MKLIGETIQSMDQPYQLRPRKQKKNNNKAELKDVVCIQKQSMDAQIPRSGNK